MRAGLAPPFSVNYQSESAAHCTVVFFFFFFCIFCNTFLAHLLQYIRTAVVAPFKHVAFIPAGGHCFCTVLGYLLRSFVSYNMLILFFTPACNCPTLIPSRFAPRGCRQLLSYFQATSKGWPFWNVSRSTDVIDLRGLSNRVVYYSLLQSNRL